MNGHPGYANRCRRWALPALGLLLAALLAGCEIPAKQVGAGVLVPSAWLMIAAGGGHTLGIKSTGGTTGTLWAWGDNTYGQLGDGTTIGHSAPVQIGPFSDWALIAAGARHSAGIRKVTASTGTLWLWGDDTFGQIGQNSVLGGIYPTPVQEQPAPVITWNIAPGSLAAGCYHTLGIQGGGVTFGWGNNGFGQAGTGAASAPVVAPAAVINGPYGFVAAGCSHSLGIAIAPSPLAPAVVGWGSNTYGQAGVYPASTSISSPTSTTTVLATATWLAAGDTHSLAVSGNRAFGWGNNAFGQVGDGTGTTQPAMSTLTPVVNTWVSVGAGQYHSLGLRSDGTMWGWGSNASLQLTNAYPTGTVYQLAPVRIGANLGTLLQIAAGYNHSLADTSLAAVFTWGANDKGQLGDGTTSTRGLPKAIQ